MAVVADASALALDALVDAAFAGRLADVEKEFAKAMIAGTTPSAIVGAALRQIERLHALRLTVESGTSVSATIEQVQPPIHFRRKPLIETALKAWTAERLAKAMSMLAEASLDARRQSDLARDDRAARADADRAERGAQGVGRTPHASWPGLSRPSRLGEHGLRRDLVKQVAPRRIALRDEARLPGAWPMLRIFLALNRVARRRKYLEVNELMDMIALRVTLNEAITMFVNATNEVTGDAYVDSAARPARKNVKIVLAAQAELA